MDTPRVPSPRDAVADVPDFRQTQGRRYELLPVLLLCCVAVMCGRTLASSLRRVETELRYALARLGIQRRRGSSQLTLHRIFKSLSRGTFRAMCNRLE